MAFAVIKNAELPPKPKRVLPQREPLYPFAELAVGDGFDCPRFTKIKTTGKKVDRHKTLYGAARSWGNRHGVPEYSVRVALTDDKTVRCVRVR